MLIEELDDGGVFLDGELTKRIPPVPHLDASNVLEEIGIARISQVLFLPLSKRRVESPHSVRECLHICQARGSRHHLYVYTLPMRTVEVHDIRRSIVGRQAHHLSEEEVGHLDGF